MALEPDTRLLHYRLVEKIGEGGMGEVWQATDTTLDRDVAIKSLPELFAADPERRARFEREAKLLASFNHPNIAAIYGLHESAGRRFLAMELVPGEDLSQRLLRGPLAIPDALAIAREIAGALEFAHEHGIVHRDLKPANIRRTPDDKIKVLDFGLAKALETDSLSGSPTETPTLTSAGTRAGVILGTAAYMSPEQARGKIVDRRADIWAFGCVFYEMLTARRAFPGETVSDTLVSVLSAEPDSSALPPAVSPRVRRLLERCLTKDPLRRLRDIGEARIVLEDEIAGAREGDPGATRQDGSGGLLRPRNVIAAGLIGLLLFAAGYAIRPRGAAVAQGVNPDARVRRLTFSVGLDHEPSISPDGNYVAYTTDEAGNLDIAVLPLTGGSVNRVVDHPADDAQARWSPDGSRLAFVSARDRAGLLTVVGGLGALSTSVSGNGGDIFLMPALGGSPMKLVDKGFYPTWSPDGSALAFQSNRDGQWDIWSVPVAGGNPVKLTDDDVIDYQPAWSPHGGWIAFGAAADPSGLFVVPAAGGEKIRVFEGRVLGPAWSADGRWLYFSSDRTAPPGVMNLWRIPFRPAGGPVLAPERVTLGEGSDLDAALSADGQRLAFSEVKFATDVWRLDMNSGSLSQVTFAACDEDYPHLAPDGRRLAFRSNRGGDDRIWSLDIASGKLLQLETVGPADNPRWSPDGQLIAYSQEAPEGDSLAVRRWGDLKTRTVATDQQGTQSPEWAPDGRRIASYGNEGIWVHTLDGDSRQLTNDGVSSFPTWSPDGHQIAYQREVRSGVREIWISPAEGGESRLVAGGEVEYSHPQWHPKDPDRILVVVDHKDLAIVRVSTGAVERITDLASSTVLVDYPSWSADGESAFFSLARKSGDVFLIEDL